MHFLTLWQASPQFLGVRANTVGKVSATTKRRLLSCMIGYFLSFLSFCLWNRDDAHCTAINTLYTRLGGEYLRRWVARSQAGHLLHNFCGSALRQPKLVHQPTTNPHQPPTSTTNQHQHHQQRLCERAFDSGIA